MGAPIELAVLEELASPRAGRRGRRASAREVALAPPEAQLRLLDRSRWHGETSTPPWRSCGWRELPAGALEILQINVGRLCNMTCRHCHVDAGPDRIAENMDRETIDLCLAALDKTAAHTVDITGGAPELNPHFRYLVDQCVARGKHVIDRCNLTILLAPALRRPARLVRGAGGRGGLLPAALSQAQHRQPARRWDLREIHRGAPPIECRRLRPRRPAAATDRDGQPGRRLSGGAPGRAGARVEGRTRPEPRHHLRPADRAEQHAHQPVSGVADRDAETCRNTWSG